MGEIRKQTIYSSIVIYIGFLFGLVNQYLLTKSGNFSTEQYGLFQVMFSIAQIFVVVASFGLNIVVFKLYHFYNDNLQRKQNDLFTWVFLLNIIGFVILFICGHVFQPLIIKKFGTNAGLLVQYYEYIFPISFGLLMFILMETFFWCIQKTVFPNFLKETIFRFLNMVLIIATISKWITYHQMVIAYSFIYIPLVAILFIYFIQTGEFSFTLTISRVTKKFFKKALRLWILSYSGQIIRIVGMMFNALIISSVKGLSFAGLYTFAEYLSNIIQVPQKSIEGASVSILTRAWKDKNYDEINRIYHRSSLNMLVISLFIFILIWLNFESAIDTFGLNAEFKQGKNVLLLLGLYKIIDMGTGVNGQIIMTSNHWVFDLLTGTCLLGMLIALNFYLVPIMGITGSALGTLIAYSTYNLIRFLFLYMKFGMQPFGKDHVYALLLAGSCFTVSYFLFRNMHDFAGICLRSGLFIIGFVGGVFALKITPDALQLVEVAKKRFGSKR